MMEMSFDCASYEYVFVLSTLHGYMCYPNPVDVDKRESFIAQYTIRKTHSIINNISGEYALKAINFYDKNLGLKYAHIADIDLHMKQGCLAGSLFLDLLEMKAQGLEPTVNKAEFLTHNFYSKNAFSKSKLTATVADRNKVGKAWGKYKWAAPIWAANLLLADDVISFEKLEENPFLFFGLIEFLTKKAKDLGLRFKCWEFPQGHDFPKVDLNTLGLSSEKIKQLSEYIHDDY